MHPHIHINLFVHPSIHLSVHCYFFHFNYNVILYSDPSWKSKCCILIRMNFWSKGLLYPIVILLGNWYKHSFIILTCITGTQDLTYSKFQNLKTSRTDFDMLFFFAFQWNQNYQQIGGSRQNPKFLSVEFAPKPTVLVAKWQGMYGRWRN